MIFGDLIGQTQAKALLTRAVQAGQLPHALLFQGPAGTGKRVVAERLATALLCTERVAASEEPACGKCRSCRQLSHGNHPDLFVITREPKKKGRVSATPLASDDETDDEESSADEAPSPGASSAEMSSFIRIHQIRELSERAAMTPREGRWRIFIIDPADRMNPEAQNALLKTLEEPSSRALLILVASRAHALLPTVRSRCLSVRFAALPVEELAKALRERGMPASEALTRAALAAGCPGAALSLDIETLRERREETLKMLEALARDKRAIADLAAMAKVLAGESEDDTAASLDLIAALLRDSARGAAGASDLVHADLRERLTALGSHIGISRAAQLIAGADRLRGDLRFHINRTLASEALLAGVAGGPLPRERAD